MAHSLILGMTESGKTTLAKRLAAHFKSKGKGVIILDPMNDPEWPCDFRTADGAKFLEVLWANRELYAVIDESGKAIGRFDDEMEQTATMGRHWGHSCFFLSQRGAQLNTTVRAQCRHLFLFTSAKDDCKVLANEYNCPELMQASALPQGHYYHKTKFGPLERGQVF